ncbi:MAG TPA: hypothetical protein PKC69_07960, partial [Chitinophagaceae bacterium]|nr:hypothetical protein [Chitinophagaceae bacterium]
RSIYQSRQKDYSNPFRKMVYDTGAEMEKVIGPFKDNVFIRQQEEELKKFKKKISSALKALKP